MQYEHFEFQSITSRTSGETFYWQPWKIYILKKLKLEAIKVVHIKMWFIHLNDGPFALELTMLQTCNSI